MIATINEGNGGQAAMTQGFKRNWYDKNPLFTPNACTGRAQGTDDGASLCMAPSPPAPAL
jgi:hypothetical protein